MGAPVTLTDPQGNYVGGASGAMHQIGVIEAAPLPPSTNAKTAAAVD